MLLPFLQYYTLPSFPTSVDSFRACFPTATASRFPHDHVTNSVCKPLVTIRRLTSGTCVGHVRREVPLRLKQKGQSASLPERVMSQQNVGAPTFPGAKLLDPTNYGNEEYMIVALLIFIVFVAIKHLIFHTMYFWWFRSGRFYIPNKFWNFCTGTTLSQRLLKHINSMKHNGSELDDLLNSVNNYFATKEFGPSLGETKGKIVDQVLQQYKPECVLVVGCHLGYCLLRILKSLPESASVYVIEESAEFISTSKQLVLMAGRDKNVTFLCGRAIELISTFNQDYGVYKFDFIFLNRTSHEQPSHLPLLHVFEGNSEKTHSYFHRNGERKTVLLADKVVMLGDADYLRYVRESDKYETKYHQMSLEHSSHEIVDGMEVAVFMG